MLAVAAASMVAFAEPPSNNSTPAPSSKAKPAATPAPVPVPMVKKESADLPTSGVSTPLKYLTEPLVKHKVESIDGMSSRPWIQIVGIRPGYSAFPPPEMHDPTMYVLWVGHDPR
ncbi:MAG TPA: hypothetical protein VGY56_11480 [Verrucomicrobiae bacterium]|nr:hypothetical protein [Verrucomicrobiae bacterium]